MWGKSLVFRNPIGNLCSVLTLSESMMSEVVDKRRPSWNTSSFHIVLSLEPCCDESITERDRVKLFLHLLHTCLAQTHKDTEMVEFKVVQCRQVVGDLYQVTLICTMRLS